MKLFLIYEFVSWWPYKNFSIFFQNWHSILLDQVYHWGRVTHKCVSELTVIGSDNGLSPGRRQAIFWTNAGILLIGPLGTNFNEILIEIHIISFKKIHLAPIFLGLNVVYFIVCIYKIPCFYHNVIHLFIVWAPLYWSVMTKLTKCYYIHQHNYN